MVQIKPKLIVTLAAAALLTVGAVYLIGRGGGNPQDLAGPAPLEAVATGEVANFRPLAVPAPVPDVTFIDAEGQERTLADFRGKLVLLNLWATWCTPCREEMPELDELQAVLGGERFEVVALSVEKDGLRLAGDFLTEVGARNLALYNDPTGKANFTFRAFGLPTTLLISPEGQEIGRMVGPAPWASDDARRLIETALSLY
ncbi:MAG: TlpA family protein disulfide reductase [Alphaproteobacteria bacterium HGW-Alphaproteobacteria-12]|nr:MAG: TlpA family protein disulfide reductase [Alphaproteobacteria bacterium HGW-Alphaproteobacteria-12]